MRALSVKAARCPGRPTSQNQTDSGSSAEIGASSVGRGGRERHPSVGRRAVDAASATTTIALSTSGAAICRGSPLFRCARTKVVSATTASGIAPAAIRTDMPLPSPRSLMRSASHSSTNGPAARPAITTNQPAVLCGLMVKPG